MPTQAVIQNILVPTDFTTDAQVAFAHGLRLAVAMGARLEILHVEPENDQTDWRWGHHVVNTLVRWGQLKPGATEADLASLGVHVRRQLLVGMSPVEATLREVARSHCDLVVVATHGRTGVEAWLQPPVSTPIAMKAAVPVLVLPPGHKGFVRTHSGEVSLSRVLIPVDHKPHPAPAFDAASIFLRALAEPGASVATLHVGKLAPETDWFPPNSGWEILNWSAEGAAVETIAETARTWNADLIVCVTQGRSGIVDALRGSTVERLLKVTPAPVLVVPREWGTDQIGTN